MISPSLRMLAPCHFHAAIPVIATAQDFADEIFRHAGFAVATTRYTAGIFTDDIFDEIYTPPIVAAARSIFLGRMPARAGPSARMKPCRSRLLP